VAETIKLTHEEFIEFCHNHGIKISKITRDKVHIILADTETNIIPNCRTDLYDKPILKDWTRDGVFAHENMKLCDAISNGQKLESIIIIRNHTDLGLKDSKDLVEANWEDWKLRYGKKVASSSPGNW
jgi:hypothetical protein